VVLYHLVHTGPKAVDDLRPGLPAGLGAIVHRAIAKNRAERFQSVREFSDELARFARRGASPASVRAGRSTKISTPTAIAETSAATPEPTKPTEAEPTRVELRAAERIAPETQPPVVASGDTGHRESRRRLGVAVALGATVLLGLGIWWGQDLGAPTGDEAQPAGEPSAELSPAAEVPTEGEATADREPEGPIVRPVAEPPEGPEPAPSTAASAAKAPAARAVARPRPPAVASPTKPGDATSTTEHAAKGKKRAVRFDTKSPYE
jgi:serine/threonine-protein kinase